MSTLLVLADDIALSRGVTLGVLDALDRGIVRATGLFANRPDAGFAADRLRERDGIDVGIDLNFVTGRPLLPASEVPALVDARGMFRSSGRLRREYPIRSQDGVYLEFETEPFDLDQLHAEAVAQVERFLALMGRPPAYVHHHSLVSLGSDAVLHDVAKAYDLFVIDDAYRYDVPQVPNTWYSSDFPLSVQAAADPVAAFLELVPQIAEQDVSVLITHPGFVDAELLESSSYSVIRAKDHELVTSPVVVSALVEAGVEIGGLSALLG
ncbi:ChbG/HpnK family deacetylase [Rathayibacter sp. Leaf296]|uniref:ChbG/HpnK family deacetylase n=1 Tax=Rathayibacter sp. Leaf296 TaxID=1736327 RepID=UPI000702B240|nr:ChbG/HpnK family deacetylase [Rathayibacter sp. Leaf296]KQQ08498.1 hypothetical protein ASF46_14460 [Rathayibacter sp. Leaf296]